MTPTTFNANKNEGPITYADVKDDPYWIIEEDSGEVCLRPSGTSILARLHLSEYMSDCSFIIDKFTRSISSGSPESLQSLARILDWLTDGNAARHHVRLILARRATLERKRQEVLNG